MSRHVNKREYTWSRFFWNEWRNDGLLQSCSLVTKGFWMDILCLMFNSERRGYLQVNGRPMTVLEISKMIHCDTRTVKRQIDILKERNVCSVDENGIIYSRRMAHENNDENAGLHQICGRDTVDIQHAYCRDTVSLHKKSEENSQKQKHSYKNRIDKNHIEDSSPQTPPEPDDRSVDKNDKVVPINANTELFTKSVKLLCEKTRLSEILCYQTVERWFRQTNRNAGLVNGAIMDGIHGNNPIPYITAIIKNRMKNPSQSYPGHEKTYEHQWCNEDDDEMFKRLSSDDQAVILNFKKEKNRSGWYIKFLEHHKPSAYRYLVQNGLIKNDEGKVA